MLFDTKEKQDLYVAQTISNMIHDQATFNINRREAFHSWHEVFGFIHEEYRELLAEIEQLKNDYAEYECLMMGQKHNEADMMNALNDMYETSKKIIEEASHVGAVSLKGMQQLATKKPSLAVEIYHFEQAMKAYNKAPTTTK